MGIGNCLLIFDSTELESLCNELWELRKFSPKARLVIHERNKKRELEEQIDRAAPADLQMIITRTGAMIDVFQLRKGIAERKSLEAV